MNVYEGGFMILSNLHRLHVVDVETPWLQGLSALTTRLLKEAMGK